ncbi:MAG: hypothetical protein ABIJ37_07810 [Pseudomonadota bacterium]
MKFVVQLPEWAKGQKIIATGGVVMFAEWDLVKGVVYKKTAPCDWCGECCMGQRLAAFSKLTALAGKCIHLAPNGKKWDCMIASYRPTSCVYDRDKPALYPNCTVVYKEEKLLSIDEITVEVPAELEKSRIGVFVGDTYEMLAERHPLIHLDYANVKVSRCNQCGTCCKGVNLTNVPTMSSIDSVCIELDTKDEKSSCLSFSNKPLVCAYDPINEEKCSITYKKVALN